MKFDLINRKYADSICYDKLTLRSVFASAFGTAKSSENNYSAATNMVIFPTNTSTQTLTITVNGDTAIEANETFFVNLTGVTAPAVILDSQGQATIINDDASAFNYLPFIVKNWDNRVILFQYRLKYIQPQILQIATGP